MTQISQQNMQRALTALHISPSEFNDIRTAPFHEAKKLLQELKSKAHQNYKQLAFELHPDRTQGNEEKTELFKLLGQVLGEINKMTISPAPPARIQFVYNPFGVRPFSWSNTSTPGFSQVQVIYVVKMKPK